MWTLVEVLDDRATKSPRYIVQFLSITHNHEEVERRAGVRFKYCQIAGSRTVEFRFDTDDGERVQILRCWELEDLWRDMHVQEVITGQRRKVGKAPAFIYPRRKHRRPKTSWLKGQARSRSRSRRAA